MSKGFIKFIIIFVIIIVFIYAFSASYSANNIDNIAYVTAMGIDLGSEDGTIEVSFEFMDVSTFSAESSSEESEPIIDTVTSTSINSAINLLNSYVGKEINLAHCKVFIFSQELAKSGLKFEVTELMNNIQVRPTSNVIVSKCTALEYMENSTSSLEKILSKYFDIFPNSSEYTGYTSNIILGEFYKSLIDDTSGNLAILGNLNEDSAIEGDRGTENIGLAVFKDNTYVGELTTMDTLCNTLISGEVNSFLLTIDDTEIYENYMDVNLSSINTPKINVDISDDIPTISIEIMLTGRVVNIENDANNSETSQLDLEKISSVVSEYLKSLILDYLNKTISEFGCDINYFYNYAKQNFLTTEEWENYDWATKYLNSNFNVSINTDVSYSLLNSDL